MEQHLASLEQDARQPRLAMVADEQANTKTCERTEGTAKAVQVKHRDSCTARRVQDGPKISTCFNVRAEPPTLPFKDDVVVENGAAAPKSLLSLLKMRTTTAAGGLLPTGKISAASETTFNKPALQLYSTEETNSKETNLWISIPSASYDTSFRRNKVLAASSSQRVVETKSGQNRTLDSAVLKVVSTPAHFWERSARCFVVRLCVLEQLVTICNIFWRIDGSRLKNLQEKETNRLRYTYCGQSFSSNTAYLNNSCRRGGLEAIGAEGANGSHAVEGGSRL